MSSLVEIRNTNTFTFHMYVFVNLYWYQYTWTDESGWPEYTFTIVHGQTTYSKSRILPDKIICERKLIFSSSFDKTHRCLTPSCYVVAPKIRLSTVSVAALFLCKDKSNQRRKLIVRCTFPSLYLSALSRKVRPKTNRTK